jgi:hypothetical protein
VEHGSSECIADEADAKADEVCYDIMPKSKSNYDNHQRADFNDTVIVLVGTDEERFIAHKDYLCKT